MVNDSNKPFMEGVMARYATLLENESDDSDVPDESSVSESETSEKPETISPVEGHPEVMVEKGLVSPVGEETTEEPEVDEPKKDISPELKDKIKAMCSEILAMHKEITGEDYVPETKETKEVEEKPETPNDSNSDITPIEKVDTAGKETIMEDIVIQPEGRDATVKDVDFSRAFKPLYAAIDASLEHMNKIYVAKHIQPENQVLTQVLPSISDLLNRYQDSFMKLKKTNAMNYMGVLESQLNTIASLLGIVVQYDSIVNNTHIEGISGQTVAKIFADMFNAEHLAQAFTSQDMDKNHESILLGSVFKTIANLGKQFSAKIQNLIKHAREVSR